MQEPQRRRLHRNEILIVGRGLEQRCALEQRFPSVPDAQIGGAEELAARRVVGLRAHDLQGERECARRLEVQSRESRTDHQCRRGIGSCRAFGEARVSGARFAGSLQECGLRGPQGIVERKSVERLIQIARGFVRRAGTHPNELRQAVVRLGEARRQSQAFAQGDFCFAEALQGDQTTGVRVMHRRCRLRAGERPSRDAFTLLRLIGRIQRDRERMVHHGIARGECRETPIVRDRFGRAAERRVGRDMQLRQFAVDLRAAAPGRRDLERRGRAAGVQVMADQQQRRAGVAGSTLNRSLQERQGFGTATRLQQEFRQAGQRGRPPRVDVERAPQQHFGLCEVAQHLFGAGEQPQTLHVIRICRHQRFQLRVRGAVLAGLQEAADAAHGLRQHHRHRHLAMLPAQGIDCTWFARV